jgi:hypothetical protein
MNYIIALTAIDTVIAAFGINIIINAITAVNFITIQVGVRGIIWPACRVDRIVVLRSVYISGFFETLHLLYRRKIGHRLSEFIGSITQQLKLLCASAKYGFIRFDGCRNWRHTYPIDGN